MNLQTDLFEPTILEQFEAWKETAGGRHILKRCYQIAAGLIPKLTPGQKLSIKHVWEELRFHYRRTCYALRKRGIKPSRVNGFALNNNFTAHIARHMMSRRKDWAGKFEVREIGVPRRKRKVIVIEERKDA